MNRDNRDHKGFWFGLWVITCGLAILLVAVALVVPQFVKARWSSSGVPVTFKIAVTDAQTGDPIAGAKVLVWINADENWRINAGSVGDISATTDARGHCEVHSHCPGSGRGDMARLQVISTIWIRADGYEPWQKPSAALLGSHLTVYGAFRTNSFPLKITMHRQSGRLPTSDTMRTVGLNAYRSTARGLVSAWFPPLTP